jgi:hypothetical protein
MRKRIAVLRLGDERPMEADVQSILTITEGSGRAVGMPIPRSGVLHIFYTELSQEEVKDIFVTVFENAEIPHPIFVFDFDTESNVRNWVSDDSLATFEKDVVGYFDAMETSTPEPAPARNTVSLSLDELLDRVSSKGIASLSADELAQLEKLSK